MESFAATSLGLERRAGRTAVVRHRHATSYAAVVLAGGYEEAGDQGRRCVAAGDVIVHSLFEAHLDRFASAGALILNITLPADVALAPFGHVRDVDELARAAEERSPTLEALLLGVFEACEAGVRQDWPDLLAAQLRNTNDSAFRLAGWARAHGLAAATVSRGFQAAYGVTPSRYRLEARARAAWRLLALAPGQELTVTADEVGFSDQAHMTRAVRALSGLPPSAWRRSNPFKTAQPSRA